MLSNAVPNFISLSKNFILFNLMSIHSLSLSISINTPDSLFSAPQVDYSTVSFTHDWFPFKAAWEAKNGRKRKENVGDKQSFAAEDRSQWRDGDQEQMSLANFRTPDQMFQVMGQKQLVVSIPRLSVPSCHLRDSCVYRQNGWPLLKSQMSHSEKRSCRVYFAL